jgi:hypothetical protein
VHVPLLLHTAVDYIRLWGRISSGSRMGRRSGAVPMEGCL